MNKIERAKIGKEPQRFLKCSRVPSIFNIRNCKLASSRKWTEIATLCRMEKLLNIMGQPLLKRYNEVAGNGRSQMHKKQ
jgi:hypothetical protein